MQDCNRKKATIENDAMPIPTELSDIDNKSKTNFDNTLRRSSRLVSARGSKANSDSKQNYHTAPKFRTTCKLGEENLINSVARDSTVRAVPTSNSNAVICHARMSKNIQSTRKCSRKTKSGLNAAEIRNKEFTGEAGYVIVECF